MTCGVICRNVQRDVVKDLPTHIDLLRLKRNSRLNIFIHVEFINEDEAPGLKTGGVLTIVRPEVELSVIAGDIPEQVEVDLTGLEVGDIVHLSDIKLPEGARPTVDRDIVIANISAPSSLRSEDEEEEGDEIAADEVETVAESEGRRRGRGGSRRVNLSFRSGHSARPLPKGPRFSLVLIDLASAKA